MKKLIFLFSILSFTCMPSFANELGLGVSVGSPTGLIGNYYLKSNESIDAGLGYHIGNHLHVHSSYLWHKPESLKVLGQVFGWYYGVGGRVKNDKDKTRLGARGSAGLKFDLKNAPIDIIAETSFVMNVIPSTDADVDLLLGIRYYF